MRKVMQKRITASEALLEMIILHFLLQEFPKNIEQFTYIKDQWMTNVSKRQSYDEL